MSASFDAFDPDKFESQFWQPIGKFVISFGYLERDVDWAIAALLQVHLRQGEAITSQIKNLSARIRLINKLCKLLTANDADRKIMKAICSKITLCNIYRNNLVHGPWGAQLIQENAWQKHRVEPQDFKVKWFELRLNELEEKIALVRSTGPELINFVQKILKNRAAKASPIA